MFLSQYNAEYKEWYLNVFSPWWETVKHLDKKEMKGRPQSPRMNARVVRKKQLTALVKRQSRRRGECEKDPILDLIASVPYTIVESVADYIDGAHTRYLKAKKDKVVDRIIAERRRRNPVSFALRYAKMKSRGLVGDQLDPFYPRYKSRFDDVSFTLRNSIHVEDGRIKLPVIGWVRLAENGYLPCKPKKICFATISEHAGDWWISLSVEVDVEPPGRLNPVTLGVSLGVMDLAATSTGFYYENPKVLDGFLKKRARLGRELARRQEYIETVGKDGKTTKRRSKNWIKTKEKIGKIEAKIANIRRHHQHNASRQIADMLPEKINVSGYDVSAVLEDNPAARHISDAGIGEVRRQIEYKAGWNGTEVDGIEFVKVSRVCSICGSENGRISYARKTYTCHSCGNEIRATINTASNLAKVQ